MGISLFKGKTTEEEQFVLEQIRATYEQLRTQLAMGRTEEEAHCSVRFSLSRYNTNEDIEQTVAALEQVLKDKDIVRLMPCK